MANEKHVEQSHSSTFLKVFVALCVLTLISIVIATVNIFPSQTVQWIAFLGVAVVKAALVVAYFMHLRWEKYWKYFLTLPALILGFLLAASLVPDIGWRSDSYSQQRIDAGPDVAANESGTEKK